MKPKMDLAFKALKKFISKGAPNFLFGLGVGGTIVATVVAVKDTPKALEQIEEKKKELGKDKLTVSETVKATWKTYLPAVTVEALSIGSLVASNYIHINRYTALGTMYKLTDEAFREYRDAVINTVGEKKEHAVQQKVFENRIQKDTGGQNTIYVTGKGNTRFYEPLGHNYFMSDIETVKRSVLELNNLIRTENYVGLNQFYVMLGIDTEEIFNSCDIGWNINCLEGGRGQIELELYPVMDKEENPCLGIRLSETPYPFCSDLNTTSYSNWY